MNKQNIRFYDEESKSSMLLGRPFLMANSSLRTIDWSKAVHLLPDIGERSDRPHVNINLMRKETTSRMSLFQVENLLSNTDCNNIIQQCMKFSLQNMEDMYDTGRNNSRFIAFDPKLSSHLWELLESPLSSCMSDRQIKPLPCGFDVLCGTWKCSGVNEAFRFNKYQLSESFTVHRDAQYCPSGDERSMFSLVIYLNDDFEGGETKFYFPKDQSICCKGLTLMDEIDKNNGLDNGYDVVVIKPKVGDAVIFSQNIIHESTPLRTADSLKCILKTDIMLHRDGTRLGFSVTDEESADYFECLNLFRRAQQLELRISGIHDEDHNSNTCTKVEVLESPSDLYDKCLSIRYSYPTENMLNQHKNNVTMPMNMPLCNVERMLSLNSNSDDSKVETDNDIDVEKSIFSVFPYEVWCRIMQNIHDEVCLKDLVVAFPELSDVKRVLEKGKLTPKLIYSRGVFTKFCFSDSDFVLNNLFDCAKVAAVYSMFLLGNNPDSNVYTVNYDRNTSEVTAVSLSELLSSVFYEEVAYGAVFKVRQMNKCERNIKDDLAHSVDRKFMATMFAREYFGIDLLSEFVTDGTVFYDEYDRPYECLSEDIRNWDRGKQIHAIGNDGVTGIRPPPEVEADEFEEYDWYKKHNDTYIEAAITQLEYRCRVKRVDKEYMSSVNKIRSDGRKVGAVVSRVLCSPTGVEVGCLCHPYVCFDHDCLNFKCKSVTLNHLIADFSKQKLDVALGDENQKCCCLAQYLFKRVRKEIMCAETDNILIHHCKVSVVELQKSGVDFSHAGCHCEFPSFRLNEYVNMSSYPLLDHVHVILVEHENTMFTWTCYGGIVSL